MKKKTVCFNLDKMKSRGEDSLTYDTGEKILKSIVSEPDIDILLYSKRNRHFVGRLIVRREVKRILGSNDLSRIVFTSKKPQILRAADEDCILSACMKAA